jgi:thiamine biosynthesis lipoprotein
LIAGACLAVGVSFAPVAADSDNELRPIAFRTQTMGTWATLTVVASDSASVTDLAYEALSAFHRVDSLMSNWTDVSEVARINRKASNAGVVVHPEVVEVIAFAQRVAEESGGAFDITIEPLVRLWGFIGGTPRLPDAQEITEAMMHTGHNKLRFDEDAGTLRFTRDDVKIDLGGIAKGYGADAAAGVLLRHGATGALVDLSGNMVAIGNAAGHEGWTVGIRDPSGALAFLARLRLFNEAVATSGNYEQFVDADGERYGHILDPRTGWPASGLASVTVVANNAMAADAWATAMFVLGPDAARRVAGEREDLTVVLIEPGENGKATVWVEEKLRPRFRLEDEAEGTHSVRFF